MQNSFSLDLQSFVNQNFGNELFLDFSFQLRKLNKDLVLTFYLQSLPEGDAIPDYFLKASGTDFIIVQEDIPLIIDDILSYLPNAEAIQDDTIIRSRFKKEVEFYISYLETDPTLWVEVEYTNNRNGEDFEGVMEQSLKAGLSREVQKQTEEEVGESNLLLYCGIQSKDCSSKEELAEKIITTLGL